MRPFALALLLAAGCGTRPCKHGTVLLSLSFSGGAEAADAVDVTLTVGSGAPATQSAMHKPGVTHGTIEIDFASSYPSGQTLTFTVVARAGQAQLAENSQPVVAMPGCTGLSLALDGHLFDGGAMDLPVPDLAGLDASVAVDSGLDAAPPSCNPHATFTSSALLANVSTVRDEYIASLTLDEKTIFVESYQTADGGAASAPNIFTSSRSSLSAAFAAPTFVTELNSPGANGGPTIMPDNSTLYFISTRGTGNFELYVAARPSPAAVFGSPAIVANVNDPTAQNYNASVSPEGTEMFFASTRGGGGQLLIYRAVSNGSSFGAASEVTELSQVNGGNHGLAGPALSASGLALYFTVAANPDYTGTHQVWLAERVDKNSPFGNAVAITEVNADSASSQSTWVSPDLCRLYVSQNRASGGVGGADFYVYTRVP